jgi:surface antigen
MYGDNFLYADRIVVRNADGSASTNGVLCSNTSESTVLPSTFPTTSTGNSVGHYHYTESTTNALQFLNASGTGTGGHIFYTSNSTTAPIETGKFDINGMTITQDNTITLYNTYNTLATDATYIIMDYNPSGSPYNWIRYNMYVVQVGNTTATLSTGVNYNVQYTDTQVIRIHTTSDPNSPYIDMTGITSVLLPYSTTGQIDTAILSSTDLTFNTVSLQETLNTLQITKTTTANQYISAAITADARPPIAPTTTITQQFAFSPAWYFKNSFASNNKINWYLGGDIGMTVSQVLGLYMNIFNTTMVSNDLPPFIVIMTTNDTPNPPNYYKSKRTYVFNQSVTPVVNTRYLMFSDVSGDCPTPFHYGSVLNNMELSTVAGSNVGAFAPTEVILAFSIHTNSAATINTVEFAVSKFGIMTPYGTQEILFIPST